MANKTVKIKWATCLTRIKSIIENEGITFDTKNDEDWTIAIFMEYEANAIAKVAKTKIPQGEVEVTLDECCQLNVEILGNEKRNYAEEGSLWMEISDSVIFYDFEASLLWEAKETCELIEPRIETKLESVKVNF